MRKSATSLSSQSSIRRLKKDATPGKKLKNLLKSVDIYAKPIQLTYQGREKFRSTCGGLLSLLVIMFIVSVFAYNIRDLLNRTRTQIKKNTVVS